ncbi:hypothetical protein P4V47_05060 [Brevibacillus laterosporus]|uniref:hypothetical protein n=1 Tax=Brevibacillus laterosporus TaxID=1465 RepID=UPI002E1D6368|nr:hypothetical protein [Brevibacillus laterosporus]
MVPFLVGTVAFQSNQSLEEVGKLISERLFGGLQFGGKEEYIHEEIPAIYISELILGLRVILSGYSGFGEEDWFVLKLGPLRGVPKNGEKYDLSVYLQTLFSDFHDFKVLDD